MADDDKKAWDPGEMFELWQEGSKAFMQANAEFVENLSENFQKAVNAPETSSAPPFSGQFDAWQNLMKAWIPNADLSAGFPGMAQGNSFPFDDAGQFYDPFNWSKSAPEQLKSVLQVMASGPRFADLLNPTYQSADTWREVIEYNGALANFMEVLQGAWVATYQRFSQDNDIKDLQSGDAGNALQSWLKIANEELVRTQGSDEFLSAQKKLLQAGTNVQARQRDMAEAWSENFQMPTRTEIDDLSKTVYQLRREVRALKRQVDALKAK